MVTDDELIDIYILGFNDELDPKKFIEKNYESYGDKLREKAYSLGRLDAILGDEIPSIDLQSNEEILNNIKNG
jgi:hypothetical protein